MTDTVSQAEREAGPAAVKMTARDARKVHDRLAGALQAIALAAHDRPSEQKAGFDWKRDEALEQQHPGVVEAARAMRKRLRHPGYAAATSAAGARPPRPVKQANPSDYKYANDTWAQSHTRAISVELWRIRQAACERGAPSDWRLTPEARPGRRWIYYDARVRDVLAR